MTCNSIEHRRRIFVKGDKFLPFGKDMTKSIGKGSGVT